MNYHFLKERIRRDLTSSSYTTEMKSLLVGYNPYYCQLFLFS